MQDIRMSTVYNENTVVTKLISVFSFLMLHLWEDYA